MIAACLIDVSDEDLLVRPVDEPEAFGVFCDRFERRILAFLSRATGRPDVAADLTAEVFEAPLVGVSGFRPELGSAQGWLFAIARHELADAWERRTTAPAGLRTPISTPGSASTCRISTPSAAPARSTESSATSRATRCRPWASPAHHPPPLPSSAAS